MQRHRPGEALFRYDPRPQFLAFHNRTERFAIGVAHRRCGKTVAAVADLVLAALVEGKTNARYAYVAPYYGQAKQAAWDYLTGFVRPLGAEINISELRVDLPTGARIRLYGADNPDSLRGIYLDGVVLDEMADMRPHVWQEIIRPTLADRRGWATFIGTPKGRNEFCNLYEAAGDDPDWMRFMLRADETGILPDEELAAARKAMSADKYAQEFLCSFDAAIQGAYYGVLMREAEEQGRITNVPHDPSLPVETWWDLGMADATVIWFAQRGPGGEVRLIDYQETTGEGLPDLIRFVKSKPYNYGRHIAPHDIQVREMATGKSRLEIAASLGLTFEVAPNLPIDDGIEAVKLMIPRCWFDRQRTAVGVNHMKLYRADFNDKMNTFRDRPRHDEHSHCADSARMGAVAPPPMASRPIDYSRFDATVI